MAAQDQRTLSRLLRLAWRASGVRGRVRRVLAQADDPEHKYDPGLIVPFGSGLILGYLMYSSGLVPRRVAWLGLIGGLLLLIGNVGVLFDWWEPTSVAFLVAPEFAWELFLGIYAAVWGFRRDALILSPERRSAVS